MQISVQIVLEPEYRLLFRDDAGQDILQYVYAGDDEEALAVAKARCHGLGVDIWQERRHVGCLEPLPLVAP